MPRDTGTKRTSTGKVEIDASTQTAEVKGGGLKIGTTTDATQRTITWDAGVLRYKYHDGTTWVYMESGLPTGAAGGDLSGFYPNPEVVQLQAEALPTKTGGILLGRNYANTAWRAVQRTVEVFTPYDGQVSFLLTNSPITGQSLDFYVNDIPYEQGVDYVVSGLTLTWLNVPFSIESTDSVRVHYLY